LKSLPTITMITPSYNQGQFIDQTIQSVLSQEYPDLQYLVIDGGSDDKTLDILRQYNGQLQWISESDRGQSHAINKGLDMATGHIIGYLNSDDIMEPGALRRVGEFFAIHPEAAWVTGKCRTVDQNGKEIRKFITRYKNFWLRFRSYKVLTILNYISQPATFWRREVTDVVGPLNEDWNYVMDYDYWLRIGRDFKLWVLAAYLAQFRYYPSSKSGSTANRQFDEELRAAERLGVSSTFMLLHSLHNRLVISAYRLNMSQGKPASVISKAVIK